MIYTTGISSSSEVVSDGGRLGGRVVQPRGSIDLS